MQFINSRVHGVIDYVFDALLFLAPTILDLSQTAAILCYTIGGVHLLMNLVTEYEFSAAKVVPFPMHGTLEIVIAIFLVATPWLFGIEAQGFARDFFVSAGVLLGLVWSTTNYDSPLRQGFIERDDDFTIRRAG